MRFPVFSRVLDAVSWVMLRRVLALVERVAMRDRREGRRMRCMVCNTNAHVRPGSAEATAGRGFDSPGLCDADGRLYWICGECTAATGPATCDHDPHEVCGCCPEVVQ